MSNNKAIVTVKDVLESAEKYGNDNVLTWDPKTYRDLKQKNKNNPYDVTYIPIKFKYIDGNEISLKLKLLKVVIASGAKLSAEQKPPKNMTIVFREFSKKELESGDNAPKKMETIQEQEIENEKKKKLVDALFESTNNAIKALGIIDASYIKICNELKGMSKDLPFSIQKNKKSKDVDICPFRQLTRENKEDPNGDPIPLEHALTRIKLMLGKSGDVGIENWNSANKGWDFAHNVYDARKMTKKNNYQPVLAKVKENGRWCNLNKDNASAFITYNSTVGGVIDFECIVASKAGLSLSNKFKDLHVKRNTKAGSYSMYSPEDMEELKADTDDDDEDVEISTNKVDSIKIDKMELEDTSDLEDNKKNSKSDSDSSSDFDEE
jgi:hypothetical protein